MLGLTARRSHYRKGGGLAAPLLNAEGVGVDGAQPALVPEAAGDPVGRVQLHYTVAPLIGLPGRPDQEPVYRIGVLNGRGQGVAAGSRASRQVAGEPPSTDSKPHRCTASVTEVRSRRAR